MSQIILDWLFPPFFSTTTCSPSMKHGAAGSLLTRRTQKRLWKLLWGLPSKVGRLQLFEFVDNFQANNSEQPLSTIVSRDGNLLVRISKSPSAINEPIILLVTCQYSPRPLMAVCEKKKHAFELTPMYAVNSRACAWAWYANDHSMNDTAWDGFDIGTQSNF